MMEIISRFFDWLKCFLMQWSDLLLILVGASALVIYILQRRNQIKSAATLLKSQIDTIEAIVKEFKNKEILTYDEIYKSKIILSKNYWEESKHLLVKKLGVDGVNLLEEFYHQAEQIEKSRAAICHELVSAWEHKDLIIQENYFRYFECTDGEERIKIKDNIKNFKENTDIFDPNLPSIILMKNLNYFRFLSGTTAYDKLSKISYYRR